MGEELVHRNVEAGIATITLDFPHNRNALSAQLRRELREQLAAALADEAVRVVILDHTGPVFCSGMDLKESSGAGSQDQGVRELPDILETLWTSPKPVVAKLAGPARAGGVGIVAACDLAVAAETATFAFSEVRIGVVPAVISLTVLPRLQPRAAHELFLTGETFDAHRAVEIGLLNSAVPAEELDTRTRRYADLLTRGAPNALAATKAMLRRPRASTLNEDFDAMLDLSAHHFASEEGQEGMRAFKEKRPASWVPEQES
ncbi:enoyl-CoA hydratase/isomerase family protein [Saccharopolyspora sp. HNM0986]|uniref:enoyl-CoA hydratase-related protein n=1 Tax=Saccharopolyspora galaxeae TaxID=2781241 RepID=UPI00190C0354|nr:enoyl-CoA hydratase-related protein [Saccharopolyspora sp. HNM0986]MBK0868256.1 enoyl-CoA hydratase/isomerase family protein [Saccharopolyspora sp. HNM0986]